MMTCGERTRSMGKVICKACSRWSSTVTPDCEHCGARLYPFWFVVLLFAVTALGAATCHSSSAWLLIQLVASLRPD
jgi:hypothetical protein